MPRVKRKAPYNPAKPEKTEKLYDRRATDFNRGLASHVTPIEIDDPIEAGAKLIAMRNLRSDPLARLHSRNEIDEAQYYGGRAFQRDFELAERGPQAIDPSKEYVDGGQMPEPITESQQKAAQQLALVYKDLGQDGSAITHDVLIHSRSIEDIAIMRGALTEVRYYHRRFRECLDSLAKVYGLANEDSDRRRVALIPPC
jgi:hypothetical protein